jgi:thiol-disulfide isomerase/thioredoxin
MSVTDKPTEAGKVIHIKLYHADWCGACHRLMPVWKEFVDVVANNKLFDRDGKPVTVDIKSYEHSKINPKNDNDEIDKANIDGFPTIRVQYDSGNEAEYEGDRRSVDELMAGLGIFKQPPESTQSGGGYPMPMGTLSDYQQYKIKKMKYNALKMLLK